MIYAVDYLIIYFTVFRIFRDKRVLLHFLYLAIDLEAIAIDSENYDQKQII